MKIVVEFNKEEKDAIVNAMEIQYESDKNETFSGKFGNFVYDKEKGFELNLESAFIIAYTKLIKSAVHLLKAFFSSVESFSDTWFDDIKHETESDDEEKKEEELICPVKRLEPEDN